MTLPISRMANSIGQRGKTLAFLAALLGALFRAIPAALSWPYPIGYDTTSSYIIQIARPIPSLYVIFSGQALHDVIISPLYSLDPTASGAFFILDAFAVCLEAVLAFEIYLYARRVANLEPRFAFAASFVFIFNLISMRLLWDQYRIGLGLVFVLLIFIVLSSKSRFLQWTALPLTILVVISNAEPGVLLVLTLIIFCGISIVSGLAKKSAGAPKLSLQSPVFWTELLALSLEGIQVEIISSHSHPGLPPNLAAQSVGLGVSVAGIVYLIYAAWPLLLIAPLGIKKLSYHTLWFFSVLFVAIVFPLLGDRFVFEPTIWLYWVISFPLAIFVGVALQKFFGKASSHKRIFKSIFTVLVAFVLCALVVLSAWYAVSSPLWPDPYSDIGATFALNQPLGYLQSTIPTSEEASLVNVLNDSLHTLPTNSTLYLGEQFYGFTSVLSNPNSLNLVPVGLIDNETSLASLSLNGTGYTIWWSHPTGWYGVSTIPPNFSPVIIGEYFTLYSV